MNRVTPKRLVLAAAACLLAAAPAAHADLTLVGRNMTTTLGTPATGQESVFLKQTRLRRDVLERGKAYTFLYDLESRQVTVLDHSLRVAEVHAMDALAPVKEAKVSDRGLKLALDPTGRTQALQSWNCAEHKLRAVMPAVLGSEPVTLQIDGTIWLAHGVPEMAEVKQFLKASESPNIFLGIPSLAKASPGQATALSELVRRLAPKGMPCAAEVDIRYDGSGRMAELARRMNARLGITYQRFSTQQIADSAFALPAGYRVVKK
jgi:hypothetical protein